MRSPYCQSCLMPFDKDPGRRAASAQGSGEPKKSDKYCSLCFKNYKLCYEGNDLKEFQKICHEAMTYRGMNPLLAKLYTFLIRFAPRWRKSR